jgi:hypothetical protein
MAISLKHSFQSAKTDGPDNTIVQPSDWNDEHVLTQASGKLLGRTSAGAGATEEISAGSGLSLSAGTLAADVTSVAGRTGAVTLGISDVANLQTSLDDKAPLASPTFTGTVTLPSGTSVGSVTSTELSYLSGVTSSIQTQISAKLSTSATTYVQQDGTTGSAYLPAGSTAQRPGTPAAGYIRYNTTTGKFEGYGSAWGNIGGGAAIGDTPPANPGAGDLWWNSADGRMYVYYTDANSSQWVDLSAGGAGQYLPLTGGTISGNVSVTGNVGIGTTSPQVRLHTNGAVAIQGTAGFPTNGVGMELYYDAVSSASYIQSYSRSDSAWRDLGINANNTIFGTSGAERMRIASNGRVGIAQANPSAPLHVSGRGIFEGSYNGNFTTTTLELISYSSNVGLALHTAGSSAPCLRGERGAGDQLDCVNSAQSAFGNFRAAAFVVASDYRLKENITPISDAVNRLKLLKPSRFNFIEGSMMWNEGRFVDGFLAHEVTPAVPEAVVGKKDELKDDGSPKYQSIDQAKLVPLLTAALQEAISRIETLEQEVATLKGGE